ncbi:MAG: hypothetical protein HYY14_04780 [Candidatus Omnitrophica bacterium]|nr:hypothetical protein [Candidatus Omnitrophota bacterium]
MTHISFYANELRCCIVVALAVAGSIVVGPVFGWAGNDVYFVTYNHHIEKGETELMIMNDFTEPAVRSGENKLGGYFSNMLELEYGVTEQFATEFMVEAFEDTTNSYGKFTGFRWENRYRLVKDENWYLNPVLYMEYEDLDPKTRFKMEVSGRTDGKGEPPEEEQRERIMETRLILSRDFGPWNVAFNWINETDVRRSGFTDFGYAAGLRYSLHSHQHDHGESEEADSAASAGRWKPVALGLELFGGLGNSRAFGGDFEVQPHYLSPILMFHPSERVMLHIGAAFGLNGVSDDLIRTGVSLEL